MDTCTIDNIGGVDRGGPYHQNVPRARSAALARRAELGTWIRQALASPRRASAVSPVFLTESAEGALNHRTTSFAWPSRLSEHPPAILWAPNDVILEAEDSPGISCVSRSHSTHAPLYMRRISQQQQKGRASRCCLRRQSPARDPDGGFASAHPTPATPVRRTNARPSARVGRGARRRDAAGGNRQGRVRSTADTTVDAI